MTEQAASHPAASPQRIIEGPANASGNSDLARLRSWGAALAILGGLIVAGGSLVVSMQTSEIVEPVTNCFGGPCPVHEPRNEPAFPPQIVAIWAMLGVFPLLTLPLRQGYWLAIGVSGVLAAVAFDFAFWVEVQTSSPIPIALFQGTLAVCVCACVAMGGYRKLGQALPRARRPASPRPMA